MLLNFLSLSNQDSFYQLLTFASLDTIPHRFLKNPEGCASGFCNTVVVLPASCHCHGHVPKLLSRVRLEQQHYLLLQDELVRNSVAFYHGHHPFIGGVAPGTRERSGRGHAGSAQGLSGGCGSEVTTAGVIWRLEWGWCSCFHPCLAS